ncbi:MAG: Bax inhibitor-1/YccA family protein [Planctomycetaceae bacterium]
MRSGNPALSEQAFEKFDVFEVERSGAMTIQGTALKAGVLLMLVVSAAAFTWWKFATVGQQAAMPWMIGGLIGGLVLAIATIFKPQWAPATAPLYAVAEGLFLGVISAMYNTMFYDGIVVQAVCLTFGTLFAMLIAYQSGIIKASEKLKAGVIAATGGIMLVYLGSFLLSVFFGMQNPMIYGNGLIGIGFSLFVVVIAALFLVLDFDAIEQGAAHGAPKYMEWYGAFSLMVTLIWLYLEILRLLSKLSSRD